MTDDTFPANAWYPGDTSTLLAYETPERAGAAAEETGIGIVLIGSGRLNGSALDDFLSGKSGRDVLSGEGGSDILDGGGGNDTISGGAGDDLIMGGKGNDRLAGGSGSDAFVFETPLNRTSNVDRIGDFSVTFDTIRIDNGVFKSVGAANKPLKAAAFWKGAQAHDASDRILYDRKTGALSYDADGTGSIEPVKFAQLKAGLGLTYKDFEVI
jgi:Ca2+-binding RTX toxin-like protein